MPSGSVAWISLTLSRTPVRDGNGVRPALLEDAERLERRAIEQSDRARVGEAIFDERDVLELHRGGLALLDDDLLERIDVERFAEQTHIERAPAPSTAGRPALRRARA